MPDDPPYVMGSMEITWGYLPGSIGAPPVRSGSLGARQALEQVVRRALEHPPCGVAFSGGRDSSLVLAVATHVARREGLPEPVPVTKVYPAVPAAEESEWQEVVVRHLGLADWHRVAIGDELDLVGPLAQEHLREYGVLWPPTIHGDRPMLAVLRGGSLIDGEGGDEVLGDEVHRIAPLSGLVRSPRPLRRRRVEAALLALAPDRLRARHLGRAFDEHPPSWLRPPAAEALVTALRADEADLSLSFAESVRSVPLRRAQALAGRNRALLARRRGVDLWSPLLHPEVVDAIARDGGRLGPGDRAAFLRRIVADLLPEAVLARTTKAEFGGAYMASYTREFAEAWTGAGVDGDLVDAEELRRLWLSEHRLAPTAALLQAAWRAGHPEWPESRK